MGNIFRYINMLLKYAIAACFITYLWTFSLDDVGTKEDKDYAVELISKCNYSSEVHRNIETDDGYLLTMQRIIAKPTGSRLAVNATPVLLMHGMLGSAEHFLLFDCKSSLSYMLLEQGYDVWLGNVRSVSYSRHHVHLDPNSAQYWDISFDDYGTFDLPTFIDYILNTTGHEKLMYVGHSQGNLIYYIMCSNKPQYADKVQLFVNLSPVASFNRFPHPWMWAACNVYALINEFVNKLGFYEWTLGRDSIRRNGLWLCSGGFGEICKFVVYLFTGISPKEIRNEDLDRLLKNCPEGMAAKQFYHACQMHSRQQFMKFDYGSREANLAHYDSPEPPQYNLTKTSTPVAIYYARNDWMLAVEDIEMIVKQLPVIVELFEIQIDNFSHSDFVIGRNAPWVLYPRLVQLMKQFQRGHFIYK